MADPLIADDGLIINGDRHIRVTDAERRSPFNRKQIIRAVRRGDVRAVRVGPRLLYVNAADIDNLITPVVPGGAA